MFASESSCAKLCRVLRDGCADTQPLKEMFCKACAKMLLAPPPEKGKEIKFQPDALDIFLEHLGGKKHPSTGVRASGGKGMAGISSAVWC